MSGLAIATPIAAAFAVANGLAPYPYPCLRGFPRGRRLLDRDTVLGLGHADAGQKRGGL